MLWNNLMCLDFFSFKLMSWKVCGSKPNNWIFYFVKIWLLAQIVYNFSNFQKKKNIYAEMVKVLW
jgi:hypothetical protein